MKKSLLSVLISSVVLAVFAGCEGTVPTTDNTTRTPTPASPAIAPTSQTPAPPPQKPSVTVPSPRTPIPPESIPPEDRAISYYLVPEGELAGLGMKVPRELTAQEQSSVIQIGLGAKPVADLVGQGFPYRTELVWMSYRANTKGDPWGYSYSLPKVTQVDPNMTYFPAAHIGLGTPQRYEMHVAVDLATARAVSAIRRPDKRVSAPPYVHYLSDAEKGRLFAIAGVGQGAVLQWAAISKGGSYIALDYNIVEAGIKDYQAQMIESNAMTIYPSLVMNYGTSIKVVAVDLGSGKIVFSDSSPVRTGPVPNPKPTSSLSPMN